VDNRDVLITTIKRTDPGVALLQYLRDSITVLEVFIAKQIDPSDVGLMGLTLGKLRAYHDLEERLLAEPIDEKD